MTPKRILLATRQYPSEDALYRYPFVHRRVLEYRRAGVAVDVFSLTGTNTLSEHEFDGVTFTTGSVDALKKYIAHHEYDTIAVHGISRTIWPALAEHAEQGKRLIGWIHGSEMHALFKHDIRPGNNEDIARKQNEHTRSITFWRNLLSNPPTDLHLVFVSAFAKRDAEKELKMTLSNERCHILPNPIGTELFGYVPKPPEHRFQVLSIRPFDAAFYANDVSVKVIQILNKGEFAPLLKFHIIGDGVLFEDTVAPLRDMENVRLERRFLKQAEIARLHRQHGIFLVPTRTDTHGVSRDEAMASGLVPVTCPVAAVPEFTCPDCAILADPDDPQSLANGIERLLRDPQIFTVMSQAATRKVQNTTAAHRIIPAELELLGVAGYQGSAA